MKKRRCAALVMGTVSGVMFAPGIVLLLGFISLAKGLK